VTKDIEKIIELLRTKTTNNKISAFVASTSS